MLVMTMLNAIILVVCIGLGADRRLHRIMRNMRPSLCLVPLCVVLGTLAGTALVAPWLVGISKLEAMGVGSGLSYYSLSSMMMTKYAGPMIGTVTLLANLVREIVSIGLSPLIVRLFGPFALIASGASSSCSVVLPMVDSFGGRDFVVVAIVSGLVLELAAPLLILGLYTAF
jgi:uncharacterized membrane protein YbjE (DUF340 family)